MKYPQKNRTSFTRRILAVGLIFILTSFFAANAATAAPTPTQSLTPTQTIDAPWVGRENTPVTVSVAFYKGMTGIGNQFAIEKGFYADAGITLELVETTNKVAAFGSGEIDFADGDPGTYIPAIINGVGMKIVGNMWRNRGAYWVIAKPEIKTWEDLKGKVVGTAQPTGGMRLTMLEVLNLNGIVEADVEPVANGIFQEAYATFVSGEVSATIIHQPFATIAEKEGTGHVLAKTWEYLPDYHTGVLVASQSLIDEQPDVVERMLEVYFYGNEYAKTHPEEFYPWAATYLNIDEDTAREAIESEKILWQNDPIVDLARLQVTEDLLTKFGMQRESLPVNDTVNNTFAEKVAQKLKLGKYAPVQ